MQRRCAWKAYQTQTQQKVPGLDFEFHCRDSVCTLGPHQTSSQAATSQDNRSQSNPRPETPQTVGPPPHAAIPLISRNGAAIPTPASSARDFLEVYTFRPNTPQINGTTPEGLRYCARSTSSGPPAISWCSSSTADTGPQYTLI